MKVKISGFKSVLHNSDSFNSYNNSFVDEVSKKAGIELVWSELDDYDCDMKLIFVESGGSEGLFLNSYKKLREPFYFLTSGGNNSLAATLEIMTYLSLHHKDGEVIHGDLDYVAERINVLARVEMLKKKLADINLGVIGKPSDWLISSVPNYEIVKGRLGINLIDIPLKLVEDRFILPGFDSSVMNYKTEFNKNEIDKATRVYRALNSIKDEYKLNGLTIRCFDLLSSIKSTGCLALAHFNDNGIIGTCEGDIMAMISMTIASALSNGPVFQANPSRIDTANNKIVFAHCTIPFKMLDDYYLDTHFESGTGVAVKGYLKEADVTIFRMSSDLDSYFVSEGKIVRNLDDKALCRTQIEVKLDENVELLLHKPCGNHHIIFYGKYKKYIDAYLHSLGFKNVK